MRVLLTRPRADSEELAEILHALKIDSVIEPLLEIVDLPGPKLELTMFQALLITSANGARAAASRSDERDLPVFTVGPGSAAVATNLGYSAVESAGGDVSDLAALVQRRLSPANGPLLHVAGSAVAGDLSGTLTAAGYRVDRRVLYRAETSTRLSSTAVDAISSDRLDGVILYSPRTAATFRDLLAAAGLSDRIADQTAFCLSRAVADRIAGLRWRDIVVAARPDQDHLVQAILERRKDL